MVDGDPPPGVDGASDPGGLDMAPSSLAGNTIRDPGRPAWFRGRDSRWSGRQGADGLAQPAYRTNV